jgi:hypothetical protein
MLGLLLGAGAANLADALIPPHGVVDFIAFTGRAGATTTFNVADIAAAVGLTLCARTVVRIARTIHGRRPLPARPASVPLPRLTMRYRMLVSAGHALLAMCAFIWIYSMAIAWTPDAGSTAPSALTLGLGAFAAAFVASQALGWASARSVAAVQRAPAVDSLERVVLDGSLVPAADTPTDRVETPRERPPRRERPLPYAPRRPADGPRAGPVDRA